MGEIGTIGKPIHLDLDRLKFSVFSSDDIRKLSVTKVITEKLFDALGHPLPGGPYDLAMGPYSIRSDPCKTCLQRRYCPGHIGHIELCTLFYSPVFGKTIYNILRTTCLHCYKMQVHDKILEILILQLKLIEAGCVTEPLELDTYKHIVSDSSDTFDDVHEYFQAKIPEYEKLINAANEKKDIDNTKTIESLRTSIINTTLKSIKQKFCMHCKEAMINIKFTHHRLFVSVHKVDVQSFYEEQNIRAENLDKIKATLKIMFATECRDYLRTLYKNNEDILKLLYPVLKNCSSNCEYPVDVFFTDVVPVTPSITRPINVMDNKMIEHPTTSIYRRIIELNSALRAITTIKRIGDEETNLADTTSNDTAMEATKRIYEMSRGSTAYDKMYHAWNDLQTTIDQTWDINLGRDKIGQGLKQTIEKKEGIIRMNMMGKRVNFAARTVITPDPYINVDEIGIPEVFAKKLSYPVPVTPWNVSELRKIIINGPDVHPGANLIENELGYITIISNISQTQRESMAKLLLTKKDKAEGMKIVHRHLLNGDVLLLNRQPSLHRPSIMAHKVRILKGEKTFRLHYSNCKSYNADFDGDEMNAHFPQNELGRSEAYNLVNVSNQYLVPKDGTPLGGLIQDHVIAGVKISIRGRFFNREDYQQLVYSGLGHMQNEIKFLPPAIIKPIRLWSGKQIFSTILINLIPKGQSGINLKSNAKLSTKAFENEVEREWLAGGTKLTGQNMTESEVIVRGGEFMVGVLDKQHYGATPFGLIHSIYELYGGDCSTQLLSSLAKLFTIFLQLEGFTLGVRDILVLPDAEKKRRKVIKKCRKIGDSVLAAAVDMPENSTSEELIEKMDESYIRDPKFRTILDRQYKSALDNYTNKINKICLPAGLLSKFPENNLQLMVLSGAKGSTVNTMQISCLLGQIELEGKRPPLMISGKSLPSFSAAETSPKSGGFIDGRFLTGIQPQDFFFHCMAGREGLIDTAVKTSRSGYLQRCLIKHLEGLNVNYDMTVRDSDNSVIQFMYGEDGMDIAKAPFLQSRFMSFLDDNASVIVKNDLLAQLRNDEVINEKMLKHKKLLKHWNKKHAGGAAVAGMNQQKRRLSSFQYFSSEIRDEINVEKPNKLKYGRRRIDREIIKMWLKADDDMKSNYSKKCIPCPDPVVSKFRPDNSFGSISEYFEKLIYYYVKERPDRVREITEVMCVKSMKSLVAPGEPVGLLAAQSIGEPSTQMTLNTFHFAGRGEMNVTLGIPRLREILMIASAVIKTPSMDIPFKNVTNLTGKAEKLRLNMVRVRVDDILHNINIKSHYIIEPIREKVFKIRFEFLPRECYKDDFGVKPKQIRKYMEKYFFRLMFHAIDKSVSKSTSIISITGEEKKKNTNNDREDDLIDEQEPKMDKTKGRSAGGDSSDEDDMNDDDDATAVKLKSKNADENEYDEPDGDEEINVANDDDVAEDGDDNNDETVVKNGKSANSDDDDGDIDDATNIKPNAMPTNDVVTAHSYARNYTFDMKNYRWCELIFNLPMHYNRNYDLSTILKTIAKKAIIYEVPQINRAITYTQNNDLILKTEGININEMFKHNDLLDINRLYTNNIHSMARTYGIEAASRVLVKEIQNVFKVYGITVNPRHLLLIADYMTFDGTYRPLNRSGMDSSASPLQQMSFESSLKFLQEATINGRCENLNSPSSRLIVGKPCKSGTGAVTLLSTIPADYLKNLIKV